MKVKVGVLVLACALGASAFASGGGPTIGPYPHSVTGGPGPGGNPSVAQPAPAEKQVPAGERPPCRPSGRPGAWSMVISAPSS